MMVLPDKCLPSVWEEVEALKPRLPHHRKHQHWHGRQQQFWWVNDITYSYEGTAKASPCTWSAVRKPGKRSTLRVAS